jgi:hypothetical protein
MQESAGRLLLVAAALFGDGLIQMQTMQSSGEASSEAAYVSPATHG